MHERTPARWLLDTIHNRGHEQNPDHDPLSQISRFHPNLARRWQLDQKIIQQLWRLLNIPPLFEIFRRRRRRQSITIPLHGRHNGNLTHKPRRQSSRLYQNQSHPWRLHGQQRRRHRPHHPHLVLSLFHPLLRRRPCKDRLVAQKGDFILPRLLARTLLCAARRSIHQSRRSTPVGK